MIFYILKDFNVFERTVIAYVPKTHRKHMVMMLKEIDNAIGSYIRGKSSSAPLSGCWLMSVIG